MNNEQFDELAGRIQALSDFLLHLTAELEVCKLIDGPHLSEVLRGYAEHRRFAGSHLPAAKKTLLELIEFLDDARSHRQ